MAMTWEDLVKKYEKETHNEHNIKEWHDLGYKGQGVRVLNLEQYHKHGKNTYDDIVRTAPEAEVLWCEYGLGSSGGKVTYFGCEIGSPTSDEAMYLDFEEFKEFIKTIDIVNYSRGGGLGEEFENLLLDNCICITSAGNEGHLGLTGAFSGKAWDIGAVQLLSGNIRRESYSSVGKDLDFVFFHYEKEGTSFAAPTCAGTVAVVKGKYPQTSKEVMHEAFKSICVDLGEQGFDESYGWGLPVLPEDGVIKVLEKTNVKQWTFRMLHQSTNYDWKVGDIVRKGNKLCRMGKTGTKKAHSHLDAVKGIVPNYSLIDIEHGIYIPLPDKLYSFLVWDLFKYNPVVTCGYLYPHYRKETGAKYEHWAIDVVPENRHITDANYDVYYPFGTPGIVLDVGTYNDGTKYIVIGVDEDMKFKDVDGHWAKEAIEYVEKEGLMKGYVDGTFKPEKTLTRAELAQVLYNMEKDK